MLINIALYEWNKTTRVIDEMFITNIVRMFQRILKFKYNKGSSNIIKPHLSLENSFF